MGKVQFSPGFGEGRRKMRIFRVGRGGIVVLQAGFSRLNASCLSHSVVSLNRGEKECNRAGNGVKRAGIGQIH